MNVKNTVGVSIGIITIIGVGLLKLLSNGDNARYSNKWFDSLSDDELNVEREKVRQAFCSADDLSLAVKLESVLRQFDSVMSKRDWNGRKEYGYPKHSEHGWYLSGDD